MKWVSRCATEEMENVTGPETIYSEMSIWLRDIREAMHQTGRRSNGVQKYGDIVLSRNRIVVVHGIPEPFMTERRQKERMMRNRVANLPRTVEIPEQVAIKRVLRQGRWQEVSD